MADALVILSYTTHTSIYSGLYTRIYEEIGFQFEVVTYIKFFESRLCTAHYILCSNGSLVT
jgi:hypothetical protein